MKEHRNKKYTQLNPWSKTIYGIRARVNNKNCKSYKNYGGRGIKNYLKMEDLKFLWIRDRASEMKRPSIDRIDSEGDYTIENCRYIELTENIRRRNYKLNKKDVCNIKILLSNGRSSRSIARQYKVSDTSINNIKHGKTWSDV